MYSPQRYIINFTHGKDNFILVNRGSITHEERRTFHATRIRRNERTNERTDRSMNLSRFSLTTLPVNQSSRWSGGGVGRWCTSHGFSLFTPFTRSWTSGGSMGGCTVLHETRHANLGDPLFK